MGKRPHKICFLADSHGLYDDRIYWKEALSLKSAGYEVHYILAADSNEKGITPQGIHFQKLQRDKYPGNPLLNFFAKRLPGGVYNSMLKAAAAVQADVYHVHDLNVMKLAGKLKSLRPESLLIYDVHEPYPENIQDYWKDRKYVRHVRKVWSEYIRRWEKQVSGACDLVITTEENMARRFEAYFPGKPVEIVYNYTNLPVERVQNQVGDKEYDAIYTGGITTRRGAQKIIEAAGIVKERMPSFRMLFLGSWFPPSLKQKMQDYIAAHGLQSNVVMQEAVPYEQVASYYAKSKIGLGIFLPMATHRIILQIKIFEYMRFGLPIVGSDFGHINDYIKQHGCGMAVDPENPEAIAGALVTLLNDTGLYQQMSENGFRAANELYRWEMMEVKLLRLYKNLLEGKDERKSQ